MATEDNTTLQDHPVDIVSGNLIQALSVAYLLGEQFEDKSQSRYNDEILQNACFTIQQRLEAANEGLTRLSDEYQMINKAKEEAENG